MDVSITLKNYRCFSDEHPAMFRVRNGVCSFVGVNNSGKSSLLKFFYEFRNLFQSLSAPHYLSESLNGNTGFSYGKSVTNSEEVFHYENNRDLTITIDLIEKPSGAANAPQGVTIKVRRTDSTVQAVLKTLLGDVREGVSDSGFTFRTRAGNSYDVSYLCEAFRELGNSLYIGPFRNVLNIGTKEDYYDIQVGEAFVTRWRNLKTGDVPWQNKAAYKLASDIGQIFGIEGLQIDPAENGQTLKVYANGHSYKLSEVGAGLTQFILVLVNAASRKPSLILIDEPELNLHPSLQLDFLSTLGAYATTAVLFATHSIGLARAASDSVYCTRRTSQGASELHQLENNPRLAEFLGELSFSGYRELGFNEILLVEGSTEVKTIHQFLRKVQEDHEVVLVPLGGSDMINASRTAELEELLRITTNVKALIDSERDSASASIARDRTDFQNVCQSIGIACHILERRATENYFTDRAVKTVKGDKYEALGPYVRLKDSKMPWGKSENWKIAHEMTKDELDGTDLGTFLRDL